MGACAVSFSRLALSVASVARAREAFSCTAGPLECMMEKVLIIAKDPLETELMRDLLAGEFDLACFETEEQAMREIEQVPIYAVLEELRVAQASGFGLANRLSRKDWRAAIPVVAFSSSGEDIRHDDCLHRGISDFLLPPFSIDLAVKRIHNATRSKESFTFAEIESILQELPSNIFLKDSEGKYIFMTHYWRHLKPGTNTKQTVRGKTDLEIRKDKGNALKAMETDRQILATGKGFTYVIEENYEGQQEFLEIIKRPTHDKDGRIKGIVALINDVTEQQRLKMELEHRSTRDPLTGLLNKAATEASIGLELCKCSLAGSTGAGALMMIDVDNFKGVNDNFGHAVGDTVLKTIGNIIHSNFKGMDVKGRVGGDEFMVFAREADGSAALRLATTIGSQTVGAFVGGALEGRVSLSIGIALCPRHGSTFQDLYKAADGALYLVKEAGKGSCRLAT